MAKITAVDKMTHPMSFYPVCPGKTTHVCHIAR